MTDAPRDHDAAISAWMQSKGWPVTERHYDVSRSIYAWRSQEGRVIITLWITRNIVEDYAPTEIVRILNLFRVDQSLARAPDKFTIIRTSDAGPPELIQLDELPK